MHKGWTGAGVGDGPLCASYRQVGRLNYFKKNLQLRTQGHDSKFERDYGFDLEYKLKTGEITELRRQVEIPLYVYGKKITTYYADYFVTYKDGHQEIIETKGLRMPDFRFKWNLLDAIYSKEHPEIIRRLEMYHSRRRG